MRSPLTRRKATSPGGPRTVLITGGASGFGLALTREFLARGDQVVVGDLADERPDTVPERADYLSLDVRSANDWDAAVAWVRERWGRLDVLVNNAGIATGGRIDVEALADWERVLDVNLLGVVRGCQAFTPMLKEQHGGHIVNTASLAGLIHGPSMSSYNSAKAGVVALSETLGFELSPWDISVSAICPGFFRTNLHTSLQGKDTAMEDSAVKLITKSPTSAETIAARAMRGIDRKKRIILTDAQGYPSYWAKRYANPLYAFGATRIAKRIAKRGSLF